MGRRKLAHLFGESANPSAKVLGGKGAGLAEMAGLGLAVPFGFTVTTTAARAYNQHGRLPRRLDWHLERGMKELERQTGKIFGSTENPLLVSVRSGAAVSMPGMMDTVLNVGDWPTLRQALVDVLRSWESDRAKAFRKANNIPDWMGTAVTIQQMVFGNAGEDSATGVVFSRNVATGEPGLYGEFLVNAQGEEVVSGRRTPEPIAKMREWNPALYAELEAEVSRLERHWNDAVDVEFTVEKGKLWFLQCRTAKRTPEAAATIAVHFVWEKRWTKEEAVKSVSREQIDALAQPGFDPKAWQAAVSTEIAATGIAASPGAAVGRAVFSSEEAIRFAKSGEKVILVRPDTSPDDLAGMLASVAIVTATGGTTSHAAVVARSLGKPAVVGVTLAPDAPAIDGLISVNGSTGQVVYGAVPIVEAPRKKEVNIFLRWMEGGASRREWPKPAIRWELMEKTVSLEVLIANFYFSSAMAIEAEKSPLAKEARELEFAVHKTTAERMAVYLVYAAARELRHAAVCSNGCRKERAIISALAGYTGSEEEAEIDEVVSVLKTKSREELIRFLALAETIFGQADWKHGFGGRKWATIAGAALGFLKGELNHSMFADHAFDLQHNGGIAFNKHLMFTYNLFHVQQFLEEKKRLSGVAELSDAFGSRVGYSVEVMKVFSKGAQLGLWQGNEKAAVRKGK